MYRIIGRISVLVTFVYICCMQAGAVDVRITDTHGSTLKQVAVGQPFLLQITIPQVSGRMHDPVVHNIEQFNGVRTGVFVNTINGTSTYKYSYTLRIDTPGNYAIGPTRISMNGKAMDVDAIPITVGMHAVNAPSDTNSTNSEKKYTCLLELKIDKKQVVVGEKISACLRFYYDSDDVTLTHIGAPSIPQFAIENLSTGTIGHEVLQGVRYNYNEWTWDMYPLVPGPCTIPVYNAHYELPPPHNHSSASRGLFMFMHRPAIKNIYSNAVSLMVDPLPLYEGKPVNGVGNFSSLKIEVAPAVVKKGEGALLKVSLEGEAHFALIPSFCLATIPDGLKWYESKNYLETDANTKRSIKHFEYVLQGRTIGDLTIPKQQFTFFDPATRTCKVIESGEQVITIVNNTHAQAMSVDTQENDEVIDNASLDTVCNQSAQSTTLPLACDPWRPVTPGPCIPFWFFIFLIVLPLFVECIRLYQYTIVQCIRRYYDYYSYKNAFKYARKKLTEAHSEQNAQMVYHIFIQLVSRRLNLPVRDISHAFMHDQLLVGFSFFKDQDHHDWQEFLRQSAACAYDNNVSIADSFWKQAYDWIQRLQQGGL